MYKDLKPDKPQILNIISVSRQKTFAVEHKTPSIGKFLQVAEKL